MDHSKAHPAEAATRENGDFPHEQLSLAIGQWMTGLPGTTNITHAQRQELHMAIVSALSTHQQKGDK